MKKTGPMGPPLKSTGSKKIHKADSVIRRKHWFLTYPQCSLSKEWVLEQLKRNPNYDGSLVCREKHEDGNYHLHAYVKLKGKPRFNPSLFDIKNCDDEDVHGHYESVRNASKCISYLQKDGDFIVDNFDVTKLVKKSKPTSKFMLETDPCKLVNSNLLPWFKLDSLIKNQTIWRTLNVEWKDCVSVRGIWIYGPPGTGKSYFARNFLIEKYGTYYVKMQNKWFDGYIDQKGILLNDFDDKSLGHELKDWCDIYKITGEVKGGIVRLVHEVFVITSNYVPETLWGVDHAMVEAIRRRCKFIHFTGFNKYQEEQ